jgi:hypothetical protein
MAVLPGDEAVAATWGQLQAAAILALRHEPWIMSCDTPVR